MNGDGAVVVAVAAVRMMQVPEHHVVHVISVGDRVVTAARAVHVVGLVRSARVIGRARVGVRGVHRERVLVSVVAVHVVEVPVVKVIGVPVVLDGLVPAARSVAMLAVVVVVRRAVVTGILIVIVATAGPVRVAVVMIVAVVVAAAGSVYVSAHRPILRLRRDGATGAAATPTSRDGSGARDQRVNDESPLGSPDACARVDCVKVPPGGVHYPVMDARHLLLFASLATAGCGAKTGLLVPDVESTHDAAIDLPDVRDVPDRPDVRVCVPGVFNLVPRAADMLFVIDRSTSMSRSLTGSSASKWRTLQSALASTLPAIDREVEVGALFYPEDGAETRTATCSFPNIPTVDIEPAVGNASRVLGVFDSTGPGGSTPTAAALLRAYTWIVRHPNRTRSRYIVLATDGAPDCNASLDPSTCVCVGGGGGGRGCGDANRCLDDVRSISTVREIALNAVTSIPTYVIGIASDGDTSYVNTLTAMAIAGGRPNHTAAGEPTFYNVTRSADLPRAFSAIENEITHCNFVTPSRPTTSDDITIAVDGTIVSRDTTRTNGWDWTDRAGGELTLFGSACPSNASPTTSVIATVGCHDE